MNTEKSGFSGHEDISIEFDNYAENLRRIVFDDEAAAQCRKGYWVIICVLLFISAILINKIIYPYTLYRSALMKFQNRDYESALEIFAELNFKNSDDWKNACLVGLCNDNLFKGDVEKAISFISKADGIAYETYEQKINDLIKQASGNIKKQVSEYFEYTVSDVQDWNSLSPVQKGPVLYQKFSKNGIVYPDSGSSENFDEYDMYISFIAPGDSPLVFRDLTGSEDPKVDSICLKAKNVFTNFSDKLIIKDLLENLDVLSNYTWNTYQESEPYDGETMIRLGFFYDGYFFSIAIPEINPDEGEALEGTEDPYLKVSLNPDWNVLIKDVSMYKFDDDFAGTYILNNELIDAFYDYDPEKFYPLGYKKMCVVSEDSEGYYTMMFSDIEYNACSNFHEILVHDEGVTPVGNRHFTVASDGEAAYIYFKNGVFSIYDYTVTDSFYKIDTDNIDLELNTIPYGYAVSEDNAVMISREYVEERISAYLSGSPGYWSVDDSAGEDVMVVWEHWPTGSKGKITVDLKTGDCYEEAPYAAVDLPYDDIPLKTNYLFNVLE